MRGCYEFLSGLEKPWRSALKYTLTAFVVSFFLSMFSIFMVWFSNTPFFDIRKFLNEVADQILVFRLSLMLVLVSIIISWAIINRNTSTSIFCALLIKIITGSYMTALITSSISRFMALSGWFGNWTDYLPWSSIYPTIALPFTIMLWGGTWWGVLVLRNHVKSIARNEGREHTDVYDWVGQFIMRELEKRSRAEAAVKPTGSDSENSPPDQDLAHDGKPKSDAPAVSSLDVRGSR
jgi:hypothetical protein